MQNRPTEGDDRISKRVFDVAFLVHKNLGPGLLESVYEACLCHELTKRSPNHERRAKLPIEYHGITLDDGLRLDVLV